MPTRKSILDIKKSGAWSTSSNTVPLYTWCEGIGSAASVPWRALHLRRRQKTLRLLREQQHRGIHRAPLVKQVQVRQQLQRWRVFVERKTAPAPRLAHEAAHALFVQVGKRGLWAGRCIERPRADQLALGQHVHQCGIHGADQLCHVAEAAADQLAAGAADQGPAFLAAWRCRRHPSRKSGAACAAPRRGQTRPRSATRPRRLRSHSHCRTGRDRGRSAAPRRDTAHRPGDRRRACPRTGRARRSAASARRRAASRAAPRARRRTPSARC